ncbi:MAG: metallophosphoesterase [Calditrichaeota bacterium]|nr:metallophosphoesterase [Calditrichota bacterium]
MKRYFFIGDIHGCADELKNLVEKLKLTDSDELISVGDIINKGPKSNEAVEFLIDCNAKAVMGNHDILIRYVHDEITQKKKSPFPLKKSHYQLYESLSDRSRDYILNLPFYYRIKAINTVVIHAGLDPKYSIEEQSESDIVSIRILDTISKSYVKRDQKGNPWYFYYHGDERIIYGHSAAQSIRLHKNTICIDTGCLYGEKLTAYILPDERFVSVKAKQVYNDYSQGGKYRIPR